MTNRARRRDIVERMESDPSTENFKRRTLFGTLIVIALLVLIYFLWQAVFVLLLIFGGVLFAVLLRTMSDGLRWLIPMPHALSLTIVLVGLTGLGILAGWLIWPPLAKQVEALSIQIPEALGTLEKRMLEYPLGRWLIRGTTDIDTELTGTQAVSRATGFLSNAVYIAFGAIVVVFIGIYVAAEPDLYARGILWLLPRSQRKRGAEVLGALAFTLRWWLLGQLVAMSLVGVLTALGLWALGIPLAFTLGLLAFLLDFVPNFGPIIAAVPAVLLAFVIGPQTALWVILLYVVVQQIESYLVTPIVQRRAVKLPPVLTIVAQVLMGVLVGPLGLLLATPLMAVAMVLVKMLYVEETLGEEIDTPDDQLKRSDLPTVPK